MKNLKGTFILLLAAFIWGTAFVAQTSAGDNIGAFTFNACRNIIGALFLFIVIAVAFTIHMFTVDKCDKADGVKLSCIQFLTSGILSGILMLIFDKADINSIMKAIIPILYAGVMSSGIAYTFQIIGQKYAKPSVTAIVLSLESVFAALAGWILLGEHLSTRELTGCILVFTAVIIAQIPQFAHNVDDSKQQVIE